MKGDPAFAKYQKI